MFLGHRKGPCLPTRRPGEASRRGDWLYHTVRPLLAAASALIITCSLRVSLLFPSFLNICTVWGTFGLSLGWGVLGYTRTGWARAGPQGPVW